MPTHADPLRPSDIQQIFQVSNRTVAKWFDTGILQGYRMPGGRVRRIHRSSAVELARQLGIAWPPGPSTAADGAAPPAPETVVDPAEFPTVGQSALGFVQDQ